MDSPWLILRIFLRLGCTSFGGPVAHLGYFRREFVERLRWFSEESFTEMVALSQFLPGPASSQLGLMVGFSRAGYFGALAAWVGFTLPSALLMILFAQGLSDFISAGLIHGMKLVAVAVVGHAVLSMASRLCPDIPRRLLAATTAAWMIWQPSAWNQLMVLALAAIFGSSLIRSGPPPESSVKPAILSRSAGVAWLSLYVILLLSSLWLKDPIVARIGAFYRAGALVFGGGHVILPLLQEAVVKPGWVAQQDFLTGYGLAQAIPGPLFTLAGFLGTIMDWPFPPWIGGCLCLLALFAPSLMLVMGSLAFWNELRRRPRVQSALAGINAAVVGILFAAFVMPVCSSALLNRWDVLIAGLCLVALLRSAPSWMIVLISAGFGLAYQ